jgi:hypothetical protein
VRCTVKKLIAIAIISASLAPRPALAGDRTAKCGPLTFPRGDLPTADEAKALKGCDFDSLYYGLDIPADPVKARKCAFVRRDAEIADVGTTYTPGASKFLIMIYANAKGVPRNLDLALALVCRIDNEEMSEPWTERLRQMKHSRSPPEFEICGEDWFGTAWFNYCAWVRTKKGMVRLRHRRGELIAKRSPEAKAELAKLEKAAADFFLPVSDSGLDAQGTSYSGDQQWAYEKLWEELNELLEQSLARKPSMTNVGFAEADAELNEAYAQMKGNKDTGYDQKRWIAYRDAWIQFGRTVHPEMPANTWKVWITQRYVSRLTEMFSVDDPAGPEEPTPSP